jgi:hypothetical protein
MARTIPNGSAAGTSFGLRPFASALRSTHTIRRHQREGKLIGGEMIADILDTPFHLALSSSASSVREICFTTVSRTLAEITC